MHLGKCEAALVQYANRTAALPELKIGVGAMVHACRGHAEVLVEYRLASYMPTASVEHGTLNQALTMH